MSFEQKDGNGALFKNKRKTADKHPDYTGQARVDGVDYWLSAWIKRPKGGGEQFMSISIKPKDERTGAGNSVQAGDRENSPDDEIPF